MQYFYHGDSDNDKCVSGDRRTEENGQRTEENGVRGGEIEYLNLVYIYLAEMENLPFMHLLKIINVRYDCRKMMVRCNSRSMMVIS